MKVNETQKVRVILRLNNNISNTFNQRAKQIGICKSQILRSWIRDSDLDLQTQQQKFLKCSNKYHFYVSQNLHDEIIKKAQNINVSVSKYLRLVIWTNSNSMYNSSSYQVRKDNNESEYLNRFNKLWFMDRMDQLIEELSNSLLEDNLSTLPLLARVYIEKGELDKATNTTNHFEDLIKKHPNQLYYLGLINSIKFDIAKYNSNLTQCKNYYNNTLILGKRLNNFELLSYAKIQFAELCNLTAYKYQDAKTDLISNLNLIDKNNYTFVYFRALIAIVRLSNDLLELDESEKYLKQAKAILDAYSYKHYQTLYDIVSLYKNFYVERDNYKTEKTLEKMHLPNLIQKNNYNINNYSVIPSYLFINTFKGNTDICMKCIDKIKKYKNKVTSNSLYKYFNIYIESKYKPNCQLAGINTYEDILSSNFHPDSGEYVFNAIKYLNKFSNTDRKIGEIGLKRLAYKSNDEVVKSASFATLKAKNMCAF